MSDMRKLRRGKQSPKVKAMCGQCGIAMSGLQCAHAETFHELQAGVRLNLRVFASHSDPSKCGPMDMEITDEGMVIGWFGLNRRFEVDWDDLFYVLENAAKQQQSDGAA